MCCGGVGGNWSVSHTRTVAVKMSGTDEIPCGCVVVVEYAGSCSEREDWRFSGPGGRGALFCFGYAGSGDVMNEFLVGDAEF